MPFGQPAGPPASRQQVQQLLALVQAAGHVDFRDARGPMGFNQRQAGGRFTREEATAFIDRMSDTDGPDGPDAPQDEAEPAERLSPAEQAVRAMPAQLLALELHRRGWIVIEP